MKIDLNTSLKNNIHENSLTKTMIKKIQITLLVEVDTENTELCPNGDPLLENCVINTNEDDAIQKAYDDWDGETDDVELIDEECYQADCMDWEEIEND